jgi:ABC-type Zn uptake system ZnuABC Zn-binding protein ZnuA
MKLYADYIKETENVDCFYTDEFFITYLVEDNNVFIYDVYSIPEIRGQGKVIGTLRELIKQFKEKGYKYIFSNTSEHKKHYEKSDEIHLKFGFKYMGRDQKENYIKKYCYNIIED